VLIPQLFEERRHLLEAIRLNLVTESGRLLKLLQNVPCAIRFQIDSPLVHFFPHFPVASVPWLLNLSDAVKVALTRIVRVDGKLDAEDK
jgi:hypothetical protein